jgi:hypothetical protein
MTCTRCGATISPGTKFCPACGAAQPPDPGGGGMPGYVPAPQSLPAAAPPPYAAGVAQTTNGLAVASLVLGILWLFWLGSLLALIFGYIGKSQIDQSGGAQGGKGLAIAGIVLGWVGVGFFCIGIISAALGH